MRRYRKGITPFRSARQRPCAQGGTFFFSSRRRHTRSTRDWSSDVCSSDLSAFSAGSLLVSGASVSLFGSGTVLHLNFDVKAGSLSWSNSASLDKLTLEGGSFGRSEERRVGKEGRYRVPPDHCRENSSNEGG